MTSEEPTTMVAENEKENEADKDQAEATADENVLSMSPILENVTIWSPMLRDDSALKQGNVLERRVVHMPPLSVDEPIQALRLALWELIGYAHFTSYRLEFMKDCFSIEDVKDDKIVHSCKQVVSPYVDVSFVHERNSVSTTDDALVLDDYGDMSPVLERLEVVGKSNGDVILRMVLEEYNPMRIREHVTRLRQLLSGIDQKPTIQNFRAIEKEIAKDKDREENVEQEGAASGEEKEPEEVKASSKDLISAEFVEKTCFSKLKSLESFFQRCCAVENKEMFQEDSEELRELEKYLDVPYAIEYSGYHPPPSSRRLLGDLAYIEVRYIHSTGQSKKNGNGMNHQHIFVTATAHGFYVNKSTHNKFDPNPVSKPCYSHTLLDCLLQTSKSFQRTWVKALDAAEKRVGLLSKMSQKMTLLDSLCRTVSMGGKSAVDSIVFRPSWLVAPEPSSSSHKKDMIRLEAEIGDMYGIDLRGGPPRDWNEELQAARELGCSTLKDRINRARMVHKILSDFGDASVAGAVAIIEGHIMPMNPNEAPRSHVYLHNNIFFSRAVDNGLYDTYRVAKGDNAARKTASRDAASIGAMHKLDKEGLYTLATVVVDYLGTRITCQSVIPGLLHGENCHQCIYGAVETGSRLNSDKGMHKLIEDLIGKQFNVASRPVPIVPCTDERVEAAKEAMKSNLMMSSFAFPPQPESKSLDECEDTTSSVEICGPLEVKGIVGADKRQYILDLTRLSPRDANWVPKDEGGTGLFDSTDALEFSKKKSFIPSDLNDDEWTMAILRNELVASFTHHKYQQWAKLHRDERKAEKEKIMNESSGSEQKEALNQLVKKIERDEDDFFASMRFNVNVFLPDIKSFKDVDDKAFKQHKEDEALVREASCYLVEQILPKITKEIRENLSSSHLPVDGASLTEYLHQNGVNCRYLGKLAVLALAEEEKDLSKERSGVASLRKMPLFWLELLECEMVARASKHVLDSILTPASGRVATKPTTIIAAFLSALVSIGEESAAETERRLEREDNEIEVFSLNSALNEDRVLDRVEVWNAIKTEVGRRFRYNLTLYDGNHARSLIIPLLRRVCQRSGIRLTAKHYDVGEKCLCHGQLSYPISASDIVDVLPMVKHFASVMEGFSPYTRGSGCLSLSLHVLLHDAKTAFESAKFYVAARSYQQALQLSQEAAELYTKVTDNHVHHTIIKCMDFSAVILFQAQESKIAASHAARCLALWVQLCGFDSHEAMASHMALSHIVQSQDSKRCMKHILVSLYLMELMAGPHYVEILRKYQTIGNLYLDTGDSETALKCFKYIKEELPINEITTEAVICRSMGIAYSNLSRFKEAIKSEQRSLAIFSALIPDPEHEVIKESNERVVKYTQLGVKQGTEDAANRIAKQLGAEAEDESTKKQKKNTKSRRNRSKKK